MVSIWVRELGFLLCGIAAAAIFYLDAFTAVQRFVVAVPVSLGIIFLFMRWPRSGYRLTQRRSLVGVGAFLLVVFEFAALELLRFGSLSNTEEFTWAWPRGLLLSLLAGLGCVLSTLIAADKASSEAPPRQRRIQFSSRFVLLMAFVAASFYSYFMEGRWHLQTKAELWERVPYRQGGENRVPESVSECKSLIALETRWHPRLGWRKEWDVHLVVCPSSCSLDDLSGFSDAWVNRAGRTDRARDRFAMHLRINPRACSGIAWDPGWGDPIAAINAFVSDETVNAWTKDEFHKWIAARNERAK